ncbi:zf-HC2 domain-containing protein [bacterium]|nr:zf-HC2 domain-containing protein [bacterium]
MNCRKAETLLADQALGFLSAKQEKSLSDHLARCHHCQVQAGSYLSATRALQTNASEQMTFQLADRVIAHARPEKPQGFNPMKWWVPAVMGAVAVLMIGIMPLFFSTQSKDMTRQEVLNAYAEDLNQLGIHNEAKSYRSEFDYETYGVPGTVSQYLN